jgi:hypothetical protein
VLPLKRKKIVEGRWRSETSAEEVGGGETGLEVGGLRRTLLLVCAVVVVEGSGGVGGAGVAGGREKWLVIEGKDGSSKV